MSNTDHTGEEKPSSPFTFLINLKEINKNQLYDASIQEYREVNNGDRYIRKLFRTLYKGE